MTFITSLFVCVSDSETCRIVCVGGGRGAGGGNGGNGRGVWVRGGCV